MSACLLGKDEGTTGHFWQYSACWVIRINGFTNGSSSRNEKKIYIYIYKHILPNMLGWYAVVII